MHMTIKCHTIRTKKRQKDERKIPKQESCSTVDTSILRRNRLWGRVRAGKTSSSLEAAHGQPVACSMPASTPQTPNKDSQVQSPYLGTTGIQATKLLVLLYNPTRMH